MTFESYVVKSPEVCVYTMASFVTYWAGLYKEEDAEQLKDGASKLMKVAAELGRANQVNIGSGRTMLLEGPGPGS